jgi:uncharacterized protein (TIGR01777 family)
MMGQNILISGGTGLVGRHLRDLLEEKGNVVRLLSRREKQDDRYYFWDLKKGILDERAIEFADVIIHLTGENVSSKRWTEEQKRKIFDSRIKSTELLFEKVKGAKKKPSLFLSASAVGYYGIAKSDKEAREDDQSGDDFLAETVAAWEKSVLKFEELDVKTIRMRFGVVISKDSAFLSKISLPVKLGLGAAVGSGDQFVPWIAIDDLVRIVNMLLSDEKANGVYNVVAPENITNREMMKELAHAMNKPFFLPNIPAFVIRLLYGEMGDIILYGKKVSASRIQSLGYQFHYKHFKDLIAGYQLK